MVGVYRLSCLWIFFRKEKKREEKIKNPLFSKIFFLKMRQFGEKLTVLKIKKNPPFLLFFFPKLQDNKRERNSTFFSTSSIPSSSLFFFVLFSLKSPRFSGKCIWRVKQMPYTANKMWKYEGGTQRNSEDVCKYRGTHRELTLFSFYFLTNSFNSSTQTNGKEKYQ